MRIFRYLVANWVSGKDNGVVLRWQQEAAPRGRPSRAGSSSPTSQLLDLPISMEEAIGMTRLDLSPAPPPENARTSPTTVPGPRAAVRPD